MHWDKIIQMLPESFLPRQPLEARREKKKCKQYVLLLLWFIVKLCKVVARRLKYFAITYKIDSTY